MLIITFFLLSIFASIQLLIYNLSSWSRVKVPLGATVTLFYLVPLSKIISQTGNKKHQKLLFLKLIDELFENNHYLIQKTRNNHFGLNKRNTTLHQTKIDEHENGNITLLYVIVCCCYFVALVLTYFYLTKGHVAFFRSETFAVSFLDLIVLICKVKYECS